MITVRSNSLEVCFLLQHKFNSKSEGSSHFKHLPMFKNNNNKTNFFFSSNTLGIVEIFKTKWPFSDLKEKNGRLEYFLIYHSIQCC